MINIEERYEKYWKSCRSWPNRGQQKKLFPSDLFETVDFVLSKGRKKLLDVGCGNGILMDITKDKVENVYGCDISTTAVREAKNRGMTAICADLNFGYLPYYDESFDSITCIEVIEHVLDPLKLLKELHRILCIKGQLVLTTPNIRYFRHIVTLLFRGTFPRTTTDTFVWGGGHLHYFTRKDLAFLLRKAGFNKIKFFINHRQFIRSSKRRLVYKLIGDSIFGEWFCNGIVAEAFKQ